MRLRGRLGTKKKWDKTKSCFAALKLKFIKSGRWRACQALRAVSISTLRPIGILWTWFSPAIKPCHFEVLSETVINETVEGLVTHTLSPSLPLPFSLIPSYKGMATEILCYTLSCNCFSSSRSVAITNPSLDHSQIIFSCLCNPSPLNVECPGEREVSVTGFIPS